MSRLEQVATALLAVAPLLVLAAPPVRSGNAIFDVPSGWSMSEQNGSVVLAPTSGAAAIVLAPSQPAPPDLRGRFDEVVRSANRGWKVVSGGEIENLRADEGYDVLLTRMALLDSGQNLSFRIYVGAVAAGAFELVTYVASTEQAFRQHYPAFESFLKTLRYSSTPASIGSSANSGIEGLYTANSGSNQFNPATGYYDYRVKEEFYLFLPGNRVYYGLPTGGLSNFVWEKARQTDLANCGTYHLQGSRLLIDWPQHPDASHQIRISTQGIELDKTLYRRIAVEDGLRLDGTFGRQGFVNTTNRAGGTGGGITSDRSITFTSDGRFQTQEFMGYTTSGSRAGSGASVQSRSQGTYRIRRGTLELEHANGAREVFTFFRYPQEENKILSIDGAAYTRR